MKFDGYLVACIGYLWLLVLVGYFVVGFFLDLWLLDLVGFVVAGLRWICGCWIWLDLWLLELVVNMVSVLG